MKKIILSLLCVLTLRFALAGEAVDRVVAVVDDQIILDSEVMQYLQLNIGSQAAIEQLSKVQVETMKAQILDDLIKQKVLLVRAKSDTNVVVQDREVDRELDARMETLINQVGGQEKLEQYYNMPLAKVKRQFRQIVQEGMLVERLKMDKLRSVKVTNKEVNDFWTAYQDSVPPLKDAIRIAHILLKDQLSESSKQTAIHRADSVRKLILSKAVDFEEYASKFSDDPGTASKGGKLGQTNRGDLVPEYEAAAFSMKEGEISEPVVSSFGVHLIKLNSRTGEKINTNHILFKVDPTAVDMETTKALADSIAKAARGGADFTELALKYSIDAKTAIKGGDLGWFSPQDLPEDFRKPLENLGKNDISEAFRTQFGVHIIKVTDRVFARKVNLNDDYERIEQLALRLKQEKEVNKWQGELAKEIYIERK